MGYERRDTGSKPAFPAGLAFFWQHLNQNYRSVSSSWHYDTTVTFEWNELLVSVDCPVGGLSIASTGGDKWFIKTTIGIICLAHWRACGVRTNSEKGRNEKKKRSAKKSGWEFPFMPIPLTDPGDTIFHPFDSLLSTLAIDQEYPASNNFCSAWTTVFDL